MLGEAAAGASKTSGLLGSAGIAVGTAGLQALMQGIANRRQNKRMVDFWKMQNEYNHPKQQIERLKEAGLNPAMMYGQSASGVTGTAGDIGRPERVEWDIDNPINKLNMFADVRQKNAQIDNLNAQNTVILQEAALKSAQTANIILTGKGIKLDNTVKRELVQSSIDAQKETTRQLELQTIGIQIDNMVKSQTAAQKIKQAFYTTANLKATGQNIEASTALRQLEASLKREGLENAPFWARWIYRNLEGVDFGHNPDGSPNYSPNKYQ